MGKVFLTITPCPLPEEFQNIASPYPETAREFEDTHPPAHLFTGLLVCGHNWEIDLSEADDEQIVHWWHEHILARCERAFNNNVIVLLAGFPLTRENYDDEIWRYAEEIRNLPGILDESSELLSLGHANVDLEHVWDEESVHALSVADKCS